MDRNRPGGRTRLRAGARAPCVARAARATPSALRALVPLALVPLAGCSDGPTAPRADHPVRLCTQAEWFAYRNEGARWTRVVPRDGVLRFDATERVAFALADGGATTPYLAIDYVTAAQLAAVYGCREEPAPLVGMPGRVRPLAAGEYAHLGIADTARYLQSGDSIFAFHMRGTTSDLVATHLPVFTPAWVAKRVVLRRAQAFSPGASFTIDFGAPEAFAPEWRTLRVDVGGAQLVSAFRTATSGWVDLGGDAIGAPDDATQPRSVPLAVIPPSRLAAGDLHRVQLGAANRSLQAWFHEPRDLTVSLGPAASMPTFTVEATTPRPRVRADVPAQPAYDAWLSLDYSQSGPGFRGVRLTATREHFGGTPATWSLPIPDLSGVDGFGTSYGLAPGALRWSLRVSSRPGGLFAPLVPSDGLVLREAWREGMR